MADAVVLIVDDDRTTLRLCQQLLERAEYQVITAVDPAEALKTLEQQRVDLLLSDIRMPIMDGFELVSQARQRQPELSVLVMTGFGSIDNAIQALHRGVDGLILKPFENSAELVQAVQQVFAESRQKRDAARMQVLRPLIDVTERLLAETSPQALEKLILDTITEMFRASHAGIYRVQQNNSLETVSVVDKNRLSLSPAVERQLVDQVVAGGQPLLVNTSLQPAGNALLAWLNASKMETLMLAPIRRNNNQFLFCACRELGGSPYTGADLEMFVILARQAGIAMENARLYSELKNYVQRVEDSQQALIQAEKMAAVGRLMATLAHEINNPLQAVRNCLHLANRSDLDTDRRLRYLEMTDSELERLVLTMRRMLDFYRPGGAEKEKADIRRLLEQVLGILAPQLGNQHIQVNVQYKGENRPVEVVPDQIQQVIFNLVLNAMDAIEEMPASGKIERVIWIDVIHEEKQVRILIEDCGPGIPAKMNKRIFEPFISTKEHGTGLGLAVSYGIMERHQGSLSVIPSRYAKGACFEMILPVGDEPS